MSGMMEKKNSKKAFTLIELMLVIALMSIVGVTVTLIMVSANNTALMLSRQTDISLKTNYVMETVQTQIKYAGDLKIYGGDGQAGREADRLYLYSEDGRVYFEEGEEGAKDLLGENFYQGYDIDIAVTRMQKNIVTLSVSTTAKDDSSISYTLDTAINVLNTRNIEGETGSLISYQWAEQ